MLWPNPILMLIVKINLYNTPNTILMLIVNFFLWYINMGSKRVQRVQRGQRVRRSSKKSTRRTRKTRKKSTRKSTRKTRKKSTRKSTRRSSIRYGRSQMGGTGKDPKRRGDKDLMEFWGNRPGGSPLAGFYKSRVADGHEQPDHEYPDHAYRVAEILGPSQGIKRDAVLAEYWRKRKAGEPVAKFYDSRVAKHSAAEKIQKTWRGTQQGKDKRWESMTPDEKDAVATLGFGNDSWNEGNLDPFKKSWEELGANGRLAAELLGFDEFHFAQGITAEPTPTR